MCFVVLSPPVASELTVKVDVLTTAGQDTLQAQSTAWKSGQDALRHTHTHTHTHRTLGFAHVVSLRCNCQN